MVLNMRKLLKVISAVCAAALSAVLCSCNKTVPTVNLSVWAPAEKQATFEAIAQKFTEKYLNDAHFTITISEEKEISCKETVISSPENAADIFIFADDQLDDLNAAGALYDVSADAAAISEACGNNPSAIESITRGGKTFAYPLSAGNGYFLYYNSDYFTRKDVSDLDSILDVCSENNKKFAMDFGSGWYIYSFFKGAGLDVGLNDDGLTNYCNFNSKDSKIKGVDVAEAMLRIASNDSFISLGSDDLVAGVKDGSIIAGVSGTWNSEAISQAYGDGYSAIKLPTYTVAGQKVQMSSFTGYKLIGISAYSENADWAMKFAAELINEENQLELFKMHGECPANAAAAASDTVIASPAVRALSEQSEFAYIQRVADQYWDPTYVFGTIIAGKNPDNSDLQKLLDTMTEQITASPESAE